MKKNVRLFLAAVLTLCTAAFSYGAGASQAASSANRGQYLAGEGLVIPSEEVLVDSYIASIDYNYPAPESEMGVYLYNSTGQMDVRGQEGILQIGIQGRSQSFESLPPMNLAFVIDASSSMNEEDKIAWVKEAAEIFMGKVRGVDYLALVCFNDTVEVVFESTRMDSPEKKQRFLDAVKNISPQGGTDLEAGLKAGYEQLLSNYREGSVNRLLFFSDGTEFSQRLTREGAQSGDIRVSLIWNNRNDLDLHVVTPIGEEIFYGSPADTTGGFLDVDMNVSGETQKPVENIFWPLSKAPQGKYCVFVQNYGYHESSRGPYQFQVEIKNGSNYSSFEGTVSGTGRSSDMEVCAFEFKGESALRREKALVYQMAESYRELGITISTIGVGAGFDLELMKTLAEEGGGSSRFLNDREEMVKTFDTEFERMAVLAARDLEMELDFVEGTEILETWGYQNRIERNKIFYSLPGLHLGDYETILVRYRLPPANGNGERLLANFRVNARDVFGRPLEPVEKAISISLSGTPVDGISSGKLLHSGTMLNFAETVKKIGDLYYGGLDSRNIPGADFLSRLQSCLELTTSGRAELENAKLRLDEEEAFDDQIEIFTRYDEMFRKYITAAGGTINDSPNLPLPRANPEGSANMVGTNEQAANAEALRAKTEALFAEIALSFPAVAGSDIPVAALSSFTLRDGSSPGLAQYLNQGAITALAGSPKIRLVERERIDLVRAEQGLAEQELLDADTAIRLGRLLGARYIITGQIIPMSSQVVVFGRVIHVETGEIVSAAQIYLDRAILDNGFI